MALGGKYNPGLSFPSFSIALIIRLFSIILLLSVFRQTFLKCKPENLIVYFFSFFKALIFSFAFSLVR